ncbi:MAG: extracellular solute-binding protein [Acetobacteraceae bacterium]|nr:extracellular solute-binding protein [Acetobacteraceae bacterium]
MTIGSKLSKLASVIAVTAGLALPAAAQQACTEMQVLLGISPNHREDVMAMIAPKLKSELGVDLVTEAIGSVVMVDRVSAQAAAPRISVVHWDVPIGIAACDRGLCAPIDLARVPNAAKLADWAYARDADGKPVVLTGGVLGVGFLYNTEEFAKHKLAPPKAWKDLARPDLAGRLGLTAPQSTMGTAELVMLAKLNGGSEAKIDPGFAETKKILANQNTVFTWSSEMSNLLQLGDLWIAVNSSNLAPALRDKGLPIQFVWPEEGSPTVNAGVSLVKDGPCQEAAYRYLDLYFSDEFQAARIRHGGGLSARTSAWNLLSKQELADLALGPEDLGRLVNLDWRTINQERPAWLERWQKEIR